MNTDYENRMESWIDDHIGMCGTCEFKKRGCCSAIMSPCYCEKVKDNNGCDEYMVKKGIHLV